MTAFRIAAMALAVTLALSLRAADAAPVVVILPFDNVSGSSAAPQLLREVVASSLRERGWTVAGTDVRPLLESLRVRYFDSFDDATRAKIVEATGASALLSGTIYTWSEARNPTIALSARLVRADGTIAWGDVVGRTADDVEGVFGLGRPATAESLASRVATALLEEFPKPGVETALVRGPRKPLFREGALAYRAPTLDTSRPNLIAVLPFLNETRVPDAARVVVEVAALRLAAAAGFETVEPATLRGAALAAGVASFRNPEIQDLQRLAAAVGTSLFLRGTIYQYVDPADRNSSTPALAVEMSLVDAELGEVLWVAQHERKGEDYSGLLMLGAVSNVVTLADRVVSEMIDAQALSSPPEARAFTAARAARISPTRSPQTTSKLTPARPERTEKP